MREGIFIRYIVIYMREITRARIFKWLNYDSFHKLNSPFIFAIKWILQVIIRLNWKCTTTSSTYAGKYLGHVIALPALGHVINDLELIFALPCIYSYILPVYNYIKTFISSYIFKHFNKCRFYKRFVLYI